MFNVFCRDAKFCICTIFKFILLIKVSEIFVSFIILIVFPVEFGIQIYTYNSMYANIYWRKFINSVNYSDYTIINTA